MYMCMCKYLLLCITGSAYIKLMSKWLCACTILCAMYMYVYMYMFMHATACACYDV